MDLANCELVAEIFLANIHRYNKEVFDICTDFSYVAYLLIAFTCKIFPTKVFLCTEIYNLVFHFVLIFTFVNCVSCLACCTFNVY